MIKSLYFQKYSFVGYGPLKNQTKKLSNLLYSLAIKLRSEDLHHLILGNGVPELLSIYKKIELCDVNVDDVIAAMSVNENLLQYRE